MTEFWSLEKRILVWNAYWMGASTINICLCDLFFVGVSHNLSLVNLLKSYPYHLAVLSRSLSENVNSNSCMYCVDIFALMRDVAEG